MQEPDLLKQMGLNGTVLLLFSARWCEPCGPVNAMLRSLAPRYSGMIEFMTIDIEEHRQLKEALNIRGVPTLLLRKDDGTVTGPIAPARAALLALLDDQVDPSAGRPGADEEKPDSGLRAFHGDAAVKVAIVGKARSGEFGLMAGDDAEDIAREQSRASGIPIPLLLSAATINGREEDGGRARAVCWLQALEPGANLNLVTSRLYEWLLRDCLRPPPGGLSLPSAPPSLHEAIAGLAGLHGWEARTGAYVEAEKWTMARKRLDEASAMASIDPMWQSIADSVRGLTGSAHLLGDVLRTEVVGRWMMTFAGERMMACWGADIEQINALRMALEAFHKSKPGMTPETAMQSAAGKRYKAAIEQFSPKQGAIFREIFALFRERWHAGLLEVSTGARP